MKTIPSTTASSGAFDLHAALNMKHGRGIRLEEKSVKRKLDHELAEAAEDDCRKVAAAATSAASQPQLRRASKKTSPLSVPATSTETLEDQSCALHTCSSRCVMLHASTDIVLSRRRLKLQPRRSPKPQKSLQLQPQIQQQKPSPLLPRRQLQQQRERQQPPAPKQQSLGQRWNPQQQQSLRQPWNPQQQQSLRQSWNPQQQQSSRQPRNPNKNINPGTRIREVTGSGLIGAMGIPIGGVGAGATCTLTSPGLHGRMDEATAGNPRYFGQAPATFSRPLTPCLSRRRKFLKRRARCKRKLQMLKLEIRKK